MRTEIRVGAGLGWAGLGWAGLGWAGLGWGRLANRLEGFGHRCSLKLAGGPDSGHPATQREEENFLHSVTADGGSGGLHQHL